MSDKLEEVKELISAYKRGTVIFPQVMAGVKELIETVTPINERNAELTELIKRDIKNIGCIYPTIGQTFYDEPLTRLAERITSTVINYHTKPPKS